MDSKIIGQVGEKVAVNFLEKKGFEILDRNYKFQIPGSPQKAEIDIIAKKNGLISFIEVKASLKQGFSEIFAPEDRVNFWKRKKIKSAAESWLNKNKIPLDSKWQINVIAVVIDAETRKASIKLFKNIV
jgi:putative endonuclease